MTSLVNGRKRRFAAIVAAAALSSGVAAAPATAGPALVEVTITNVANNNTVTIDVPVNVAANVCAQVLAQTPPLTCTANAGR